MTSLNCLEIVGLPGAGKTALAEELRNRNHQFRLKSPHCARQPRNFPFFIKNSFSLAPALASLTLGRHGRLLNQDEFHWMIFLNGWHRQLIRQGRDGGCMILDQGPVYMLSQMILYRKQQMMNPMVKMWWEKTLEKWRPVVDGVIRLDASDNVLARRINQREKNHIIKGTSWSQTRSFLERARVALDQAICLLKADRCTLAEMHFDTGRQSLNEIADRLLREFKLNEK